eukprot:CAMPEP_0201682084 /NCGR_PEP_ID=MMETSP0494-20130426/51438_1 /ASSEMBLY_ACC=CAM_ASM_000839 /TAXON_ID=420259 /ORGANISM="Thalassiosira gravida, Strain GMp14c1" /LENGTH=376 /DNA_ID=CAMNT_0048165839 /DNA_START=17 /DNA_END=1148 /DNA_ORIENTATION=+
MKLFILSIACLWSSVESFQVVAPPLAATTFSQRLSSSNSALYSATSPAADVAVEKKGELLKRDRYIASNRFTVRPGREAKFEKRWADRSSRLASLDGFRYFQLMRRVSLDDEANSGNDPLNVIAFSIYLHSHHKRPLYSHSYRSGNDPLSSTDSFGNYVSFTIWHQKKHFNAWRTGDAFREAHGGTSLFAFVTTMVSSAMVLTGAPKPAFYDGLLQQSLVPDSVPQTVDGWRSVQADGANILPAESFVAMNQFFVPMENAAAFEQRWAGRTSKLKECDGFVSFTMLRRDVRAKGHGIKPMGEEEPTYTSCTVWKDRASFDGWRNGMAFKEAHGQTKKESGGGEEKKEKPSGPPLWSKPPVPVFYEGTLVISSQEGA